MNHKIKIPICDLSSETNSLWEELTEEIQAVLKSGQFIMGPKVTGFEEEIADYLGVKHAIGVNSGTDALVIGLRSAGVCAGDEVVTTPFTFFATAEAIALLGATPVFVDIDPKTFNINVEQIEEKITPRTKALLPVHLFGHSCDMDRIMGLARSYRIQVIEDVAQAFGGQYNGKKLGTFGAVSAFSFFPSKNLGAYGDGGLIATNFSDIAQTAMKLRSHGSIKKYHNELIGYNSRLDELQAAILRVKLPHIEEMNEKRRKAAHRYSEALAAHPSIQTPWEDPDGKHVYHQYTVRIKHGKRNAVQEALTKAGISTMIYYPVPVHKLPVFASLKYSLKETEKAAEEVLSLPIWPDISVETQLQVIQQLEKALLPL